MKTYKITVTNEPENLGTRMTVHGLRDLYFSAKDGPSPEGFTWLLRQYDYDKSVPPYWSVGISEQRCFTLPFAVYVELYDLCQVHEDLHDGDEMILEHEGQTYTTIVNTWPECRLASEAEQAFRTANDIKVSRE